MISARRMIDLAFALSLSVGVGVLAVVDPLVGRELSTSLLVVLGFLVSVVAAFVIGTQRPDIASNTIWKYSAITFVVFVALGTLLDTGVTAGDASPISSLVVWLVSVLLSYGFYRYRTHGSQTTKSG